MRATMTIETNALEELKNFIHPFEKPRIANYRDHGFDNMDAVYRFTRQLLLDHPTNYANIFENTKHFLSVSVATASPIHREVTITVGYIDYQDKERFVMGSITLAHLDKYDTVAVISSRSENNEVSLEIEEILLEIQNKNYMSLYSATSFFLS